MIYSHFIEDGEKEDKVNVEFRFDDVSELKSCWYLKPVFRHQEMKSSF